MINWYVLAKNNRDEIRIYGLDRIEYSGLTNEGFVLPEDFDGEDFFSLYFGVTIGTASKPEKIIIRANGYHKYYMQTQPIHHSQVMIEDHGEYSDFDLYLIPTLELEMKLLQYGSMIEVLKLESLRSKMRVWAT